MPTPPNARARVLGLAQTTEQRHEGDGPEQFALDAVLPARYAQEPLLALGAHRYDEPATHGKLRDQSLRDLKRGGRGDDAVKWRVACLLYTSRCV